jgi:phytoene synthase
VDDVVDEASDVGVARLKLDWWRHELERLVAGTPQHPVTRALAPALERYAVSHAHLQEVVDGMEMDLDQQRYADFKELTLYCHRVAGVVGLMSAEIFGYANRRTLKYAHTLGVAFQLTNILRDVREDAMRGRIYLPQDELARHGLAPEDLNRSQTPPQARALFAFQAGRAREHYARAMELLPEEDRHAQRSGLVMAAIYRRTLDEIEADGFRVLERRVSLTPLRKLWVAWRTVRREHRRRRSRARAAPAS